MFGMNLKLFFERVKRQVNPPNIPKNTTGEVCIHLGCGAVNAPGFINVDALPYSHVHYVHGLDDLDMFPNSYANLIYACHVLEHFSHRAVAKVLNEWKRVLQDGGILRISVPDFDKIVGIYLSESKDIKTILMPLMGGQGYSYNFHKNAFNEKHLKELLLTVGFREVRLWNPEEVDMHSFEDWASRSLEFDGKKYPISLNIEAVK